MNEYESIKAQTFTYQAWGTMWMNSSEVGGKLDNQQWMDMVALFGSVVMTLPIFSFQPKQINTQVKYFPMHFIFTICELCSGVITI